MNKTTLALEISYVLELPVYHRHDKASEILKTVLDTIASALHRGEKVTVKGFGTLEVRERPARLNRCVYFYGRRENLPAELVKLPARKYVHFAPSKPFLRMIQP